MGEMLCENMEESDNESGPSIVEAAAKKKLHFFNKIYVGQTRQLATTVCRTASRCTTAIIT